MSKRVNYRDLKTGMVVQVFSPSTKLPPEEARKYSRFIYEGEVIKYSGGYHLLCCEIHRLPTVFKPYHFDRVDHINMGKTFKKDGWVILQIGVMDD